MHYMLFCRDKAVWQFDDGIEQHVSLKLIKEKRDITGALSKSQSLWNLGYGQESHAQKSQSPHGEISGDKCLHKHSQ